MFILSREKATYTHPVTVYKPVDDGKFQKGTFTAEFNYLEQPEIDQVLENARLGQDNGDLCAKAWAGWKGDLVDQNKEPLPFSEEAKTALLAIPYVRAAVLTAFIQSISGEKGRDEARRKNS